MGYDHPCLSFVYNYVLFVAVFLALCIFVVGGVAYVYMCVFFCLLGEVVFWICVLVHIYLCFVWFSLFCIFVFLFLVVSPRLLMRTL